MLRRKDGVFARKPVSSGQAEVGFALDVAWIPVGGKSGTGRNFRAAGSLVTCLQSLALTGPTAGCSCCEGQTAGLRTQPEPLAQPWGQEALQVGCLAPCSCWDRQHRQGEAVGFPPWTSFVLLKQS